MKKENFSDIQSLILNCKKSVFIRSWENAFIEARYPENKECLIGESNGLLSIDAKSYLILSAPVNVPISVERIYGNFELVGQSQKLNIENVSGNCSIQSVEELSAENIAGNCKIGNVKKDASIRNVSGNFSVGNTEGSLKVNGVGGNFSGKTDRIILSTSVGGNIKISANHAQGTENHLRAGGNIKLNLMDLNDLSIDARSGGIVSYEVDEQKEKFHNGKFSIVNGSGENKLLLKAGGNVKITNQFEDIEIADNFGTTDDEYVDQIEQKFDARARQTSGFDFSDLFDIDVEIGDRIREKTRMADEKIQRAMEKMERKFSFREEFGTVPKPPKPPSVSYESQQKSSSKSTSISHEERLLVLQMLQDKKISAEEAERLLRALEQS